MTDVAVVVALAGSSLEPRWDLIVGMFAVTIGIAAVLLVVASRVFGRHGLAARQSPTSSAPEDRGPSVERPPFWPPGA